MNNIGERIKELRKKNDLTQEKLADYLGVTYQSVSKWECGINTPDISLIGPLTKLLHVSADELLGLTRETVDERKAYFDREYFEYWKKDHEEDLEIARQAVKEYPGDFKYLEWLASDEWYVGYSTKYAGTETEKELLKSSEKHLLQIIEDCKENEIKYGAMQTLIFIYTGRHQYDKAKEIAHMYPEKGTLTQDDALEWCLRGDELDKLRRKRVRKKLNDLCLTLKDLWQGYNSSPCTEALNAHEAVIKAVITDENYLAFHHDLCWINLQRSKNAIQSNDQNEAITALKAANFHAEELDKFDLDRYGEYTCPVLSGYAEDYRESREQDWTMAGFVHEFAYSDVFKPLYEHEDFKALFNN